MVDREPHWPQLEQEVPQERYQETAELQIPVHEGGEFKFVYRVTYMQRISGAD